MGESEVGVLMVGEIRTCLLHASGPLPREVVRQLLDIIPGRRVRSVERPIHRAAAPEVLTGVDCRLATASGTRAQGIGIVGVQAVVTGGLLLQASARTRLRPATATRRLPWSHYAERPGTVEVISQADEADLAAGFLLDDAPRETLDLGSVAERLITQVQLRPQLDRTTTVRAQPTRLRWSARPTGDGAAPRVEINQGPEGLRTMAVTVPAELIPAVPRFCADFALHDWLLTTLDQLLEQAQRAAAGGREPIEVLRPAVEQLLHLWMPGAHVAPALLPLWDGLERTPGFTRQWTTQVARVRDQISLKTLQALDHARRGAAEW